ncbi:MAG: hypothetical protein KKB31_03660 [Nanoarchaeota archaeon]|nr:hypothetical protein [Nanoarchaeota archaeon]
MKRILFLFGAFFLLISLGFIYSEPLVLDKDSDFDVQFIVEPTPIDTNDVQEVVGSVSGAELFSGEKVVYYRDEIPITIDYDEGTYSVYGKEYDIIVDGGDWETSRIASQSANFQEFHIPYDRFNVFIDYSEFTNGTLADWENYFNEMHERFVELESEIGWTSEMVNNGKKLDLYVYHNSSAPTSCWRGYSIPGTGEAHIELRSDFWDPDSCWTIYFNDSSGSWELGNPGELGDNWRRWQALHELVHGITPADISGDWIREGLAEYYQFNILSNYNGNGYPDITQSTADIRIQGAIWTPTWGSFSEYASNNYMDRQGDEIQESSGYDITAWMFSMMRDGDHNYPSKLLDWSLFYDRLNNNLEVLWGARSLGDYYSDTIVIDVFGRAAGMTWEETNQTWRYDGASGPGWGVRKIMNPFDWYPDLTAQVFVSNNAPYVGQTVKLYAIVRNEGGIDLENVLVGLFKNSSLLDEQVMNISKNGLTYFSFDFDTSLYGEGDYIISVIADQADIKIESNDTNNYAEYILQVRNRTCSIDYVTRSCTDLSGTYGDMCLDFSNITSYYCQGGDFGSCASATYSCLYGCGTNQCAKPTCTRYFDKRTWTWMWNCNGQPTILAMK